MDQYSQKKIIILGASELQVPAILAAKKRGIKTVVVDYDENATGRPLADEFQNISTMDFDQICSLAKSCKADGIMTICSDRPMKIVAKVGEALGLNTIKVDTSIKATNKAAMRQALENAGVPIPEYSIIKNGDNYSKIAMEKFTFPFIVKPSDNSGSRGISLVKSEEDLPSAFEYAKKNSTDGVVLFEDYMVGDEVSVEAFVSNGIINIIQITDKMTTGAPHFVETGHTQPSRLGIQVQDEIATVATDAIRAIGIDRGPSHVEIKITEDGAKIVELGARLGGDYITTDLVKLSTGVDMVDAAILSSLGIEPKVERKFNRMSAIRYFSFEHHINLSNEAVNLIERMYVNKLEKCEILSSNDREGFYIISADSFNELENKIEKFSSIIK